MDSKVHQVMESNQIAQEIIECDNQEIQEQLTGLRLFAKSVYDTAKQTGKYSGNVEFAPLIMHTISELTESVSAFLRNDYSDADEVDFGLKNIDNPMFKDFFKNNLKSKFEDEIADAILMLFSISGYLNIDIAKHLVLKNRYNLLRNEHSVFNNYDSNASKQNEHK